MTAPNRTAPEDKAVAQLLKFMSTPEQVAEWHQKTGYLPVSTRRLRAFGDGRDGMKRTPVLICRSSSSRAER